MNPPKVMKKRYILCRPQGGLNDILSQIERCCRYAEKTRRRVLVDTSTGEFADDFGKYFASRQRGLELGLGEGLARFAGASVLPKFLEGRVETYTTRKDRALSQYVDTLTDQPVTFDLSVDHPEDLLVIHQNWRMPLSHMTFLRMTLQPWIVDEWLRRQTLAGLSYRGLHIRNTDYVTDYEEMLSTYALPKGLKLFLATDNKRVLHDFRDRLGEDRVLSFSKLPDEVGAPLHRTKFDDYDVLLRNRDAIIDLLMLASGLALDALKIRNGFYQAEYSGYSQLAFGLWRNKAIINVLAPGFPMRIGLG